MYNLNNIIFLLLLDVLMNLLHHYTNKKNI